MSKITGLLLLLLLSGLLIGGVAAQETERPRARLVMDNGDVYEVRGPVRRENGLVLFYGADGKPASMPEGNVRDVQEVKAAPKPAAKPKPKPAARVAPAASESYSNADLPEPVTPAEPAEPAAPPVAEAPAAAAVEAAPAAETAPADPIGDVLAAADVSTAPEAPPAMPLVEMPTEVGGHDEAWWVEQASNRRNVIAKLEERENVTYRLLACAYRGVSAEDCRPAPNVQAPVNRQPRTPEERSLARQLGGVRGELERARAELSRFIGEAMSAGVPTTWIVQREAATEEAADDSETPEDDDE